MKKLMVLLGTLLVIGLFSGCTSTHSSKEAAQNLTPSPEEVTGLPTPSSQTETITIYAPVSTSSIPVILAAQNMPEVNLVLYTDQSQANAEFIRGDADVLVSGLSVGVDMRRNGVPVQVVNSFVSGLSYLVSYGQPLNSLDELDGKSVYVPFEGSPIDQVMNFLVTANGLKWKEDVTPVYAPFDSSIALLKEGKLEIVVLPEPSVTLVEDVPNVFVNLDLAAEWDIATGVEGGYPQVATFVSTEWASSHNDTILAFNQTLQDVIEQIEKDPAAAVEQVKDYYKIPADKLLTSLSRTRYSYVAGQQMQTSIEMYYATIGAPLDENFKDFYFVAAH